MVQFRDSNSTKTGQELNDLAGHLASGQTTMTLATARSDVAWAAPVYYVFFKSAFYFLSAPESRHIKEALENGRASSAIYASGSTWQEIRGLQMSGSIHPVEGRLEAFQVLRAYLKQFPFTKDFFKKNTSMDPESFWERFGVKLYRFKPSLVYYLDNRIRFAFREEVKL
ncbi:MAG: hypothetical protein GY757_43355 [bacterium]|nr:hypothetical protein [bacterium]